MLYAHILVNSSIASASAFRVREQVFGSRLLHTVMVVLKGP